MRQIDDPDETPWDEVSGCGPSRLELLVRTVIVTIGTMCLTIVLLAVGQRLVFTAWSTFVWDQSAPVESMVFDELVLYALFPAIVAVGTIVATVLTKSRPFVVAMLGTLPAFIGVVLMKRFEIVSMMLLMTGYTLLCFSIVKLTPRLWVTKRHSQRLVSPGG